MGLVAGVELREPPATPILSLDIALVLSGYPPHKAFQYRAAFSWDFRFAVTCHGVHAPTTPNPSTVNTGSSLV